jgi:hypothetical protein
MADFSFSGHSQMQTANQNDIEARINTRLRTIRTLWFALCLSVGLYYVFTLIAGEVKAAPNPPLSLGLAVAGGLLVILSFPIRNRFLAQSVERQDIAAVQVAYIIGLAVCEIAALLGMLDHYVTGNRYYYLLFIIAGAGELLHFPRRRHLQEASYKRQLF